MGSEGIYPVKCDKCGYMNDVPSPRLDQTPIRVWPTDFGLCLSTRIEIYRTVCQNPDCRMSLWVKFEYPEHPLPVSRDSGWIDIPKACSDD
jgi:hypothetical protein